MFIYPLLVAIAFILLGYTRPPFVRIGASAISVALAGYVTYMAMMEPRSWVIAVPLLALWGFGFYRHRCVPSDECCEGHCPNCNYDLTGNTSGRCPECGTPV